VPSFYVFEQIEIRRNLIISCENKKNGVQERICRTTAVKVHYSF